MPIALIQLISEQTMPNLLPVLALEPARLVHLTTESTASRSTRISEAAAKAGLPTPHENIRLSPMPSIEETRRAVERAIAAATADGLSPVLNFTGGTKLMSIGAHAAAHEHAIPSFYVDTRQHLFDDGATGTGLAPVFGGDLSFARLAGRLNLDVVVVANGHHAISTGRDWQPLLPGARYLLEHPDEEERVHKAFHGPHGLCPNGVEPRKPGPWLALVDKPFELPRDLAETLAAAGLLRTDARGRSLLPDTSRRELAMLDVDSPVAGFHQLLYAAVAPLQAALGFLTGGWWEVILADACRRSGRFSDIRWSAHIIQQSGSRLEEDIVCLDGVEAACISCKRGASRQRLLAHLEEFQSRASAIGGHFTRRFLAVRQLPAGSLAQAVSRRAAELGIAVLRPADLERPDPFDNPR